MPPEQNFKSSYIKSYKKGIIYISIFFAVFTVVLIAFNIESIKIIFSEDTRPPMDISSTKENKKNEEENMIPTENTVNIIKRAPKFTLQMLNGKRFFLSDNFAPKNKNPNIVILNFMSTTCKPCIEEYPILAQIANDYKHKNVLLFFVFCEKIDDAQCLKFMKEHGINFPGMVDYYGNISKLYSIQTIPQTFIIDKDQMIKGHFTGKINTKADEIRRILDSCLSAKNN